MRFYAHILNEELKKIGLHGKDDKGIVDLAVYSAKHDMRLPNCVKWKDRKMENRKF